MNIRTKNEQAEDFYLKALQLLRKILGNNNPNTKKVNKNFINFLREVINKNQTDRLSNDPRTQKLLKQLLGNQEENEKIE